MSVWSLNEVEALARKAARGAGMTWGVAEDAGKATRWLEAAALPGAKMLAGLLTAQDGTEWGQLCPDPCQKPWRANGGMLCPIATGILLSDLAHRWVEGEILETGAIRAPLFLLPFIVSVADGTGSALSLSWEGAAMRRADGKTHVHETTKGALVASRTSAVRLEPAPAAFGQRITRAWRAEISAETAATLGRYAKRLYAPETPERRAAGAGADR